MLLQPVYCVRLGGAFFGAGQRLDEWFPTVETNPVIVSFTLQPIFDLLTNAPRRFPNDSKIFEKSDFIASVLEQVLNQTQIYCENGCTDPSQGTCEYTGFFMFGMCKCKYPWIGIDCSRMDPNATTTSTTITSTTTRRWFG